MKKIKKLSLCKGWLLILALVFLLIGPKGVQAQEDNSSHLKLLRINSAEIADNLIDEPTEQKLMIYLPPSYYSTEKRYPVVYYLHGFGENVGKIVYHADSITEAMSREDINEFIIVEVEGNNRLQGSFYVNSPVIGNWENYFIKEVIPTIDQKFRTIPEREARGISGFSMGGYSAINLAFKHPELFFALFSVSPGLFAENGLEKAMDKWNNSFLNAYGAAFSPNLDTDYPYANIPEFTGSEADNKIIEDWENGFGNLSEKISNYLSQEDRLNAIRIEYGSQEFYEWIPEGCVYLAELLLKAGIAYQIECFYREHSFEHYMATDTMLPFFSTNLKFKVD